MYLVQFFISLLVNLHRRHRLLNVTQDHVQVLIVGLEQTTKNKNWRTHKSLKRGQCESISNKQTSYLHLY